MPDSFMSSLIYNCLNCRLIPVAKVLKSNSEVANIINVYHMVVSCSQHVHSSDSNIGLKIDYFKGPQCCISFVDFRLVSLEQKTTFQRYYFSVYGEVALFIDWRALGFMFLFNNRCEGKHRCNIIMYRNIV